MIKSHDDFWEEYTSGKPVAMDRLSLSEESFKAGMLAAADIAELAKDYILPADDLADVIATQIRNYANEPSNERP